MRNHIGWLLFAFLIVVLIILIGTIRCYKIFPYLTACDSYGFADLLYGQLVFIVMIFGVCIETEYKMGTGALSPLYRKFLLFWFICGVLITLYHTIKEGSLIKCIIAVFVCIFATYVGLEDILHGKETLGQRRVRKARTSYRASASVFGEDDYLTKRRKEEYLAELVANKINKD